MSFLIASPELETTQGNLLVRQNLDHHSVTIGFKPWLNWDSETEQVFVTNTLIHFVEPNGSIVGIKVLGGSK